MKARWEEPFFGLDPEYAKQAIPIREIAIGGLTTDCCGREHPSFVVVPPGGDLSVPADCFAFSFPASPAAAAFHVGLALMLEHMYGPAGVAYADQYKADLREQLKEAGG